jgi:hypothetical protein
MIHRADSRPGDDERMRPEDCIVRLESRNGRELAPLLDDVRQLIVDAWDAGMYPQYLILDGVAYDAVAAAKQRELPYATELYVLGLRVRHQDRIHGFMDGRLGGVRT